MPPTRPSLAQRPRLSMRTPSAISPAPATIPTACGARATTSVNTHS